MFKKIIKKTIAAITLGVMLIAPMNVFAAEAETNESKVVAEEPSTRGSSSFRMVLPYNAASVTEMQYMGFRINNLVYKKYFEQNFKRVKRKYQ